MSSVEKVSLRGYSLDRRWWILLLSVAVVGLGAARVTLGEGMWPYDVQFWEANAKALLGGQTPYVDVVDNKPPGLFVLIAALEATGKFRIAWLFLATASMTAVGLAIQRICRLVGRSSTAHVASLFFIATLPILGIWKLAVRLTAVALLTWGIAWALADRHVVAGVAIGTAGMLVQWAVTALPILVILWRGDSTRDWGRAVVGLSAPAVLLFGGLGLIYGTTAVHHGVIWTFAIAISYIPALHVLGVPDIIQSAPRFLRVGVVNHSFFGDPLRAGFLLVYRGLTIIFVLVPAGLSLVSLLRRNAIDTKLAVVGVTAMSFSLPLLFRAYSSYWLYSLPFWSILAADWFHNQRYVRTPT